jgi:hypothetical protein
MIFGSPADACILTTLKRIIVNMCTKAPYLFDIYL